MGASKTEQFSKEQNHIAGLLKAMGHPARVAIVEHLLNYRGCICTDIVKELPLAQPTVSQHLQELKKAGIIRGEFEGKSICYCIDRSAIQAMRDYFGSLGERLLKDENECC